MPLAIMGGARCWEVEVMRVVEFFMAGLVDVFVAANPRGSLATHLPRWRPRRAGCGRAALARASGVSGFVLVCAEGFELVSGSSWSCWWCGFLRQRGVVLVSSATLWGLSTCCWVTGRFEFKDELLAVGAVRGLGF